MKKLINKKEKKLKEGECFFCNEPDYGVLDCHRVIIPGSEKGKYTDFNTCVCCSNCHRKIHNNKIKVIGKYYTSKGCYVINYIDEDGNEQIKEV